MSLISLKESIAGWTYKIIIRSASILYGCLGFMLSVMTAVIHFFFPALTRGPLKSHRVTRSSSRQTFRRKIGARVPSAVAGSASSLAHSVDTSSSSEPNLPKSPRSLKLPAEIQAPLPYPIDDYFPPMAPLSTSEVPQVVVTKTSLDGVRDQRPAQQLENIGKRPGIARCSTIGNNTLHGSRSMSFFRSKGNHRATSDQSSPKALTSEAPTSREKERKKKPQIVRPRTQPYEAPYFFPTPTAPSAEFLRPRPDPVRSFTMPAPLRRVSQ
ncbi:hypothetical protein GGU11DRAFT_740838 [Lentinula aff. detonsa]|uniref:Uncharacterized protein n=1 Tax=Lentinula aff. detonsa TaxID=2804958 RepID=A0AA38TZA5_9AGAR|nr:hypothetical protein GGU10DRAFT_399234 [Lentinula aff. detonsa]KAJ3802265.1 hypothetical protein GGU11DRAFT_740838 [Lentinula aff. detonsa]